MAMAADPESAAADPSKDPGVLAIYRQRFSLEAAGARYRARLEELWVQRRELAGRLKRRGIRRVEGVAGARRGWVGGGWRVPAAGA